MFIPKLIPKVLKAAETVCVHKRERETFRQTDSDREPEIANVWEL